MTTSSGLRRPRKPPPALPIATSVSPAAYQLPESLSQLHYYATLLQQLHARHKNQHRGQLWFKQLNLVRRALRDLLDTEFHLLDLQRAQHSSQNSSEDVRKRFEQEKQLTSRTEHLTEWIREVLVPQCYVRFSVLVADGDGGFANLGVVLVAAVAGLAAVTGLPKEKEEDGKEKEEDGKEGIERVVHAAEDKVKYEKQPDVKTEVMRESSQGRVEADINLEHDFGTVVDRAKLSEGLRGQEKEGISAKEKERTMEDKEEQATDQGEKRLNESGASSEKTKREREPDTSMEAASRKISPTPATIKLSKHDKKRAKGKKNAIDDLFEGFT